MHRSLQALFLAASLAAFARPALAQEDVDSTPPHRGYAAWLRGRNAERAGDPETALAAYTEALRLEPASPEYRALVERMRFAVATSLANRAERDMLAGNSEDAAAQLRQALRFDPSNQLATERLRQIERHTVRETTRTPDYAASAPVLSPQPGTHNIDFHGSVRGAWLELAKSFGLLAVFDDDISSAQIRFNVAGLGFQQAAAILGQQTGTFIRALDPRTFLVVNDTLQKRKEFQPQIERTLLLPESEKPEQMNEVVRAVRDISGLTRTAFDTRTRSLTVRGPERDVALATALVHQLEQPRGEVMVEIDILEVDRNAARNLGIIPPSSAQIITLSNSQLKLAAASTNGLVQLIEQLFGTPASFAGSSTQQISSLLGTGAASLSALIPPLVAFGGGQTIFLATLPGASVNFAQSLSVVQDAKRVLLRAEDGEPATFFVGERFPINFATLSNEFTAQGAQPGISESTLGTGPSPRGAAAAILRSNSTFLDIITANHDADTTANLAGTVSVLLGNGDGTFQAATQISAGTNPVAVATGTFRPAGSPVDLAVVDQGSNSVQILLGNGDGTFQAPVSYPVGNQPSGIVLADFNGDGHTDIAVTNTAGNSVSILLGNGDANGTFQSALTIPLETGQGPVGITAADFNGDGHLDIAVANSLSNPGTATILHTDSIASISRLNDTVTATLGVALAVPGGNGGSVNVSGVTDASFNGTFIVNAGSGTTTLQWTETGTDASSSGGFAVVQNNLETGAGPVAVASGGFNSSFQCPGNAAQPHPDLAVANQTDGTVTIFLNQCDGSFSSTTFSVGNQPDALIAGDFNNDSNLDLVVSNSTDGSVTALFGIGNGTFPANIPIQVSGGLTCSNLPAPSVPCQGLASADFNHDGLADLVVTDAANNTVTVVINSNQIAAANAQLPYPGFQYEDIGIKAKATPHIHPNGDVTLTFSFELRSLSATSVNGIPILTNRTIEQTVRLKPGEPSVLSGIFSNQKTLTVTGIPGAAEIPVLQQVTSNRNTQEQGTELVVVVNPRLVRLASRTEEVYYVGHERQAAAGSFGAEPESPQPNPLTPGQPPFTPGGTPPTGQPPPARPRP